MVPNGMVRRHLLSLNVSISANPSNKLKGAVSKTTAISNKYHPLLRFPNSNRKEILHIQIYFLQFIIVYNCIISNFGFTVPHLFLQSFKNFAEIRPVIFFYKSVSLPPKRTTRKSLYLPFSQNYYLRNVDSM